MKIKITNKARLATLVAGAVFVVGVLLSFYAFERVSIPHVRDAHEIRPLFVGIVFMLSGAGFLFYRWRQAKNKPTVQDL